MKRVVTKQEEFDIMKLVLDKFLWLGVFIMGYGFYLVINQGENLGYAFTVLAGGAILLLLFVWILMKEFNYVKS